jgi:predicted nuclease of restriction endonuclease-like (RecB) superfamily
MSTPLVKNTDYKAFLIDIKQRIQSAQIKAAVSVNQALIALYWDMAEQIMQKQQSSTWGDGFLAQMSKDLQLEFPEMKGFSKRNLELMRQWRRFWQTDAEIAKQLVAQIPLQTSFCCPVLTRFRPKWQRMKMMTNELLLKAVKQSQGAFDNLAKVKV